MQDFRLATYSKLLQELLAGGYSFQTLEYFIQRPEEKAAILRHDVDRLPENALAIARIEKEAGINGSYYFRIVKESYDEDIIKQISEIGHEIGYHYENMDAVSKKKKPDPQITQITRIGKDEKLIDLAYEDFCCNLEKLKKITDIKTICMHGSQLSKWDNRMIWEKYSYKDLGIIAEPYFDVDYDEVFYITDTGRAGNHSTASIRDKVKSKFDIKIKNTHHLIEKIQNNELPDKIMLNVHPQRWTDDSCGWYKELILQSMKNQVKSMIVKYKRFRNG